MADPLGKSIRYIAQYPGVIISKTKITPDQLTFIGFLVNCIVGYFIAIGKFNFITTGVLIWIAGFFDALDGSVARASGRVTVFGNFFDSVMDRYSDSAVYFGILLHFLRSGRTEYVVLTALAIIGSMAISYTRAKAESLGLKCEVGLMPRAVRILILGASFCFGEVLWGLAIIAVFSHLTVAQRVFYVRSGFQNKR